MSYVVRGFVIYYKEFCSQSVYVLSLCVGGVVPLVLMDVGCVLVSVYMGVYVLQRVVFAGSYDGFCGMFLVVFGVWLCGCLYWRW